MHAALVVVAALAGSACKREEPTPTKIGDQDPLAPHRRPERTGPFKSPKDEPPGPREGQQLDAQALEKALAEADEWLAKKENVRAMRALMGCVNKVEQSVPCEARMAMAILPIRNYRAHALYYLAEASKVDQPEAPTSLYRDLANVAIDHARFEEAAAAIGIIINRGEATAQDYAALANALAADSSRIEETIDALEKAYALDDTQHDWLRDRAILVAQTGDAEKALGLFEEYRAKVPGSTPELARIDVRIAELRRMVQAQAAEGAKPKAKPKGDAPAPARGADPAPG